MHIAVVLVSWSGSMHPTLPPGGMASVRVRRTSIDPRALLCVQAASEDVCLWDEEATSQSQSGKRDETVRAALMFYQIKLGI